MKVFDSGMPDEAYWNSLFDIAAIVDWLDLGSVGGPVAEIGCGYGTFTVPIARHVSQTFNAIDIEPAMIERAAENARMAGVENVSFLCRDVLEGGTGLPSDSTDLVLLFNILHSPERVEMLKESSRILKTSGRIAIIHWRKDIPTPRGPSVDSRPDLRSILDSVAGLDLRPRGDAVILAPYHWGVQLHKGST